MRISFDLDGVITNSEKWFFGMLSTLREVHSNQDTLDVIEILYYSTRLVKHNPYMFMAIGDVGYIITARKPISRPVTEDWLVNNGISLEVVYIDVVDDIDWSNYKAGSIVSAHRKAEAIKARDIKIHLDNNPYIINELRKIIPDIVTILVGGEPCLSYM